MSTTEHARKPRTEDNSKDIMKVKRKSEGGITRESTCGDDTRKDNMYKRRRTGSRGESK